MRPPSGERRYENTTDPEREGDAPWQAFTGADGPFHDSPQARVTLLSTGSLGDWDRRRFRANVVLAGDGEDRLVGERLELGEAVLAVREQIGRCVITTRAQPGGLERDLSVLRRIARERDGKLAVGAVVERDGIVRVGDRLERRA